MEVIQIGHCNMLELNFDFFPVLKTERLVLRRMDMQDAEEMLALRTAIDAERYLGLPFFTRTREEVIANIEKIENGIRSNELIAWAITLLEDPKIIGTMSFHKIDKANHRAEIGYLLNPVFWGVGIVSEATKAILDYGFNQLGFHSVEAHVNPENQRSVGVLQKFDFEREGYFRENYFCNGQFTDTIVYSLLKRNFIP